MDEKLENVLFEKYPKIFADRTKPPTESLMCFGCCCEDGWYELLDTLCETLQRMTDGHGEPQIVAFQVKEKFGTLRFYANDYTPIIYGLISLAESLSTKVCEQCGTMANVALRAGPWLQSLCDECYERKTK